MSEGGNVIRLSLDQAEALRRQAVGRAAESAGEARPAKPGRSQRGGATPAFLPDDCPVEPLGTRSGVYYYLDAMRQLRDLRDKDHGRLNIQGLFGRELHYLPEVWPQVAKDGSVKGFRAELAAEALMSACAERGVWDPLARTRGAGGWADAEGHLILHCGDRLARSEPGPDPFAPPRWFQPGVDGRAVYPAAPPQPRPADRCPAPEGGPGEQVLALLSAWAWRRPSTDPRLLLGWLAAAVLGGALEYRTPAWITGDTGTGKSTLLRLLRGLLDEAVFQSGDASAAAIRQVVGHASLPVMLDESEAEESLTKINAMIRLARLAATGDTAYRGGADHGAAEFTVRSAFLFSSVLLPPLLPQDRNRMAILELDALSGVTPPEMAAARLRDLGAGLRRRLLDQWWRWPATLDAYRQVLAANGMGGRGADAYGTLLAAGDLVLFGAEPDSEELGQWGSRLAAVIADGKADAAPDWRSCLDWLASITVLDGRREGRAPTPVTLGALIAEAAGTIPEGAQLADREGARRLLGPCGLAVDRLGQVVSIANNHRGVARLFDGSHWSARSGSHAGVWVQALLRVPGAVRGNRRIGGLPGRCVDLPVLAVLPDLAGEVDPPPGRDLLD